MKHAILIATALLLAACDAAPDKPVMTNAQIIAATRECEVAGMQAVPYHYDNAWIGGDPRIRFVQCEPKSNTAKQ